jgi:hypothetical protein
MSVENESSLGAAKRIGLLYGAFQAALVLMPGLFVLGLVIGWIASTAEGVVNRVMSLAVGAIMATIVLWQYRRRFGTFPPDR